MPSTRSEEVITETVASGSVLVEWEKVHIETSGQGNCNAKIADSIKIVISQYRSPVATLAPNDKDASCKFVASTIRWFLH